MGVRLAILNVMRVGLADLQLKANEIRQTVIKMLLKAGTGHSAGALGSADFWTTLYFGGVISYDPKRPDWEDRDRVVLSAGHYVPVVYAVLAEAGFFPKGDLDTLRSLGSKLQGHPVRGSVPGVEISSGSLGQGVSQAVGMAIALKLKKNKVRVICFMGDGEQQEGQTWEAYMSAAKYRLDNLLVVVDRNNIQIDGYTEEVMPLEPFRLKLEAFGFYVIEVDGHNSEEIVDAVGRSKVIYEKPTAVILRTTAGKGVEFMENEPKWHGAAPNSMQAKEALIDLKAIRTLNGRVIVD